MIVAFGGQPTGVTVVVPGGRGGSGVSGIVVRGLHGFHFPSTFENFAVTFVPAIVKVR